jgi:sortase A
MSDAKGAQLPVKKKKNGWVSTVILLVILLAGVGVMLYPTISDWWNSVHQSRAIAVYNTFVEQTDNETIEAMLQSAREYNQRLPMKSDRFRMSDEEIEEYESLLDLSGTGVMGYIQIPRIGVNLPVYHGTDEEVLQIAIGHIEGSSLPVGGETTHAVLSGHRGLPSAKLFTDLDKMEEGDIFTLTVLNQILTYQVDQISVVLPSDVSELSIVPGMDYCTLVTCTPYGINTHRLLVRGHRIENIESDEALILPEAILIPAYIVVSAVGIPLLFLFLAGMLLCYRRRRPRHAEGRSKGKHERPKIKAKDDGGKPESR